jgi:hypothetical protein
MSRTIKRKNLERAYRPYQDGYYGGGKIAGYYTEYDCVYDPYRDSYYYVYREPTKIERFKRWQEGHGERPRRHCPPLSKDERKIEEKRHRMRARNKIKDISHGLADQVVIDFTPRLNPSWWW